MKQSNPIDEIQTLGAADGASDQHHAEEFIIQTQGLRPVVKPAISTEHVTWVQESDTTKMEQLEEELKKAEEEILKHLPWWVYALLLLLTMGVEIEAGILYWKDQGVTGVQRIVIAAATAATTLYLPWLLIELAKKWQKQ
jgi:hypothetical protein